MVEKKILAPYISKFIFKKTHDKSIAGHTIIEKKQYTNIKIKTDTHRKEVTTKQPS